MKIGIIGTGRMGSALGRRWSHAGHQVMFGSRTPEKAVELSEKIGGGAQGGTHEQAVAEADVIVLAVPFGAARETLAALGDLGGKILLDITNDFAADDVSSAEQIAAWTHNGRTVKAFNTIFHTILTSDKTSNLGAVFYVGDDDAAKATVGNLIRDAGFDPIDTGVLTDGHFLDTLLKLIIQLSNKQGIGGGINYRVEKMI